jgi:hypothetical protein
MAILGEFGRQGRDTRAQSTPLGYLIVLAIIIGGIVMILALGTAALDDTRGQSELERAEHAMTLFDSRAAMVALGTSSTQQLSFGQDSGSFTARNKTGYISLQHHNYTDGDEDITEELYNESIGSFVYDNGETSIAYQGGGVWRSSGEGEVRMISPPEFHYRDATLTLPIIRVANNASASGNARVSVSSSGKPVAVFPNRTTGLSTANGSGLPYDYNDPAIYRMYENPVSNGTVYAKVQSEYYEGWAEYFRERTTGDVTVWDSNETVKLELLSLGGAPGDFDLPNSGDSVGADSLGEDHPISEYTIQLDVEKNKPHFSFYDTDNGEEFEIHLYSDVNPNSACPGPSETVHLSVYYYNGSGENRYQSFETATPIDPGSSSAMTWDCRGAGSNDLWLEVDFTDDSEDLTYDEVGSSGNVDPGIDDPNCGTSTGTTLGNKYAFNEHMGDCNGNGWGLWDGADWDQHSVSMEPDTYTRGDTQTLNTTVNHYMELMGPDLDLVVKTGPGSSDPINEDPSTGELEYAESAGSEYIAYLHVTENEIEVDT